MTLEEALNASDPLPNGTVHAYAEKDGVIHHAFRAPADLDGTPGQVEVYEESLAPVEDPAALAGEDWQPCGADGRLR